MSAIHWFENPAFDAPELKSPQPCIHGAGCVYTKKTADGKVVPGVCGFVHPGEEGKGRRLFPARTIRDTLRDGSGKIVQPPCVRLIGNALYYERMRQRMPWQAFCAEKGIPFTANVPGVLREPVRRVPIGSSKESQSRLIRHIRTVDDEDFLVTSDHVTRLMREEAVRFGLRAPVSAVPTLDQSWPVLPVPHAAVETEVIAASNGYLGVVLPRPSWSLACESDGSPDYYDNCDECGKPVEDCAERGDHGDEKRWEAEQAMW